MDMKKSGFISRLEKRMQINTTWRKGLCRKGVWVGESERRMMQGLCRM